MKLSIDSTNNLETHISLGRTNYQTGYTSPREQDVFGSIIRALDSLDKPVSEITQIQVNPGPGSFTGIRVGVSIAQALAFALQVPINNQSVLKPIPVNYGQKPSITPLQSLT